MTFKEFATEYVAITSNFTKKHSRPAVEALLEKSAHATDEQVLAGRNLLLRIYENNFKK